MTVCNFWREQTQRVKIFFKHSRAKHTHTIHIHAILTCAICGAALCMRSYMCAMQECNRSYTETAFSYIQWAEHISNAYTICTDIWPMKFSARCMVYCLSLDGLAHSLFSVNHFYHISSFTSVRYSFTSKYSDADGTAQS